MAAIHWLCRRSPKARSTTIPGSFALDGHDKIEVRNLDLDHPRLAGDDPTVVAIAANGEVADAPVPVFSRDDVTALATFIERHMELA